MRGGIYADRRGASQIDPFPDIRPGVSKRDFDTSSGAIADDKLLLPILRISARNICLFLTAGAARAGGRKTGVGPVAMTSDYAAQTAFVFD